MPRGWSSGTVVRLKISSVGSGEREALVGSRRLSCVIRGEAVMHIICQGGIREAKGGLGGEGWWLRSESRGPRLVTFSRRRRK